MKNRRGGHIAAMAFRLPLCAYTAAWQCRTGEHYSLTTSTRHLSFRRSSNTFFLSEYSFSYLKKKK